MDKFDDGTLFGAMDEDASVPPNRLKRPSENRPTDAALAAEVERPAKRARQPEYVANIQQSHCGSNPFSLQYV
jgi:hypothetical protein